MGLRISKEHGLNPTMLVCGICGKPTNSIALLGASYHKNGKEAEAPHTMIDVEPCDDCKNALAQGGIFFIEVKDGESGENPYRTGRIVAVNEEAVKKILTGYDKVNYIEEHLFTKLFK